MKLRSTLWYGVIAFVAVSSPIKSQPAGRTPSYPGPEFRDDLLKGTSPSPTDLKAVERIAASYHEKMRAMNNVMIQKSKAERLVVLRNLLVDQAHDIAKVLTPAQRTTMIANYNEWAKKSGRPPF